jgi:hypothetical protein
VGVSVGRASRWCGRSLLPLSLCRATGSEAHPGHRRLDAGHVQHDGALLLARLGLRVVVAQREVVRQLEPALLPVLADVSLFAEPAAVHDDARARVLALAHGAHGARLLALLPAHGGCRGGAVPGSSQEDRPARRLRRDGALDAGPTPSSVCCCCICPRAAPSRAHPRLVARVATRQAQTDRHNEEGGARSRAAERTTPCI